MKNKVLFNFGCIKDRAKIEAGWIKDRVITYAEVHEHNKVVDELAEPVEEVLKAFMIINEKNVDVELLKNCEDIYEYNMHFPYREIYQLTEEEFNLLKKTLLNPTARTAQ